ncbi:MAG TPA: hypothetical protein VFB12_01505 [Ktedonobacteraceae bacterium]|nr:hypothetical protein [Ktedonobacteraceae bacterium]
MKKPVEDGSVFVNGDWAVVFEPDIVGPGGFEFGDMFVLFMNKKLAVVLSREDVNMLLSIRDYGIEHQDLPEPQECQFEPWLVVMDIKGGLWFFWADGDEKHHSFRDCTAFRIPPDAVFELYPFFMAHL